MQRKAEFVVSIHTGGITYSYEECSIIKIVINVTLAEIFAAVCAKGDASEVANYVGHFSVR